MTPNSSTDSATRDGPATNPSALDAVTPHSPASSPELPKLPDLPLAYYAADYIRAYATAHGLACYEAGRASHAAPTVPVDAVAKDVAERVVKAIEQAYNDTEQSVPRHFCDEASDAAYGAVMDALAATPASPQAPAPQAADDAFAALRALTEAMLTRADNDYMLRQLDAAVKVMATRGCEPPVPWPDADFFVSRCAAPQAVVGEASAPNYLNWVLHPRTADLVLRFSYALAGKLSAAEKKYGYNDGWAESGWMDECREKLMEHIDKGDPRDVAAYCAFLWHHGESTAGAKPLMKTIADLAAVFDEGVRQGAALTPSPAPSAAPQEADALREAVRELLECPYVISEATVPSTGLDTPGLNLYQVVGTMHVALPRYRALKAALAQHQPPQQGEPK